MAANRSQISLLDVEREVRLDGVVHVARYEVEQGDLIFAGVLEQTVADVKHHERDAVEFERVGRVAGGLPFAVDRVPFQVEELKPNETVTGLDPHRTEAVKGSQRQIGSQVVIDTGVAEQDGL